MEALLHSFTSLKELECSFFRAIPIDWKGTLSQHQGLRRLHVSSKLLGEDTARRAKAISNIMASRPMMKYLAFPPLRLYPGDVDSCQFPFTLYDRLYESLQVITSAPNLHNFVYCMHLAPVRTESSEGTPHGLGKLPK